MNVAIVTSFPFPNGKATANRIQVFADELQKNAKIDRVEIICCSDQESNHSFTNESLKISNIKVGSVNKNRMILRALHEINVAIKLWRRARSANVDLVLVTVPSIFLLIPLMISGGKEALALDIRDVVWTYFGEGAIPKIASLIVKKLFSYAARRADIISVTNTQEAQHVALLAERDPIVVSNGISISRLLEMSSLELKHRERSVKLAYVGNVGIAQELDRLLDFSKKFADLEVTIVGDGAKLRELKARCNVEVIENVSFTGAVTPDQVLEHISSADILFAQIGVNFRSAVPTKVFEYIASGRKILLGLPNGPAREVFSKFYGVEIFDVGNDSQFEASFRRLLAFDLNHELRELNLTLLKQKYIREDDAAHLVRAITEIR